MEDNELVQFYSNATILVTGGNGFLGKVLVEKLLRCFNVKKIYLLIRSKNNATIEERLASMLNESLFCKIRETNPDAFNKIVPIEVDYTTIDLNIDEQSLSKINDEVEIVFNSVASVKFNEKLKDAIEINIVGTQKVISLVRGIKNMKTFVHVSTIFSNCGRLDIAEKLYEKRFTYQELITIAKVLDCIDSEKLEPLILEDLPNTYTLTKHYSEKLVTDQAHLLPCGIFRPPVVMSVYKDPLPGWTDNINGPSGIVAWTVRGVIHCIWGDPVCRSNIVPVDYCINALIASAWDISLRSSERLKMNMKIPIYNYCFKENNITWKQYMSYIPLGFHEPLEKFSWYYSYFIIKSKYPFYLSTFILHLIPGFIMDLISLSLGRKMVYTKAFNKTQSILKIMSYFGSRQWEIENYNVLKLTQKVSQLKNYSKDLEFDMRKVNWEEYFRNYIPGFRHYVYKEDPKKAKRAAVRYKRMKTIHESFKFLLYLLLIIGLIKQSKRAAISLLMRMMRAQ